MSKIRRSKLNVICVDGSEHSENAFNWYAKNYHQINDSVLFVHVQQKPSMPLSLGLSDIGGAELIGGYYESIQISQKASEKLRHKYKKICKEMSIQFKFSTLGPHHCPGHLICEAAKEENAASIIMGQRGLGKISRMLLGSTSDYVLHHANMPVMIIPKTMKN